MTQPIDQHLGKQLKKARKSRGLSQSDIAATLNISYQQVQKYERGSNRISAARLYQLSDILKIPVMYFFDGLPAAHLSEEETATGDEAETLLGHYNNMPDDDHRLLFKKFVRALSNIGL